MRQYTKLFPDFKEAYDSVRREVLYNIITESGVPIKLSRLFKMCLNLTHSKVRAGKHLSDNFPMQNGLKKKEMLYRHCFSAFLQNIPLGRSRRTSCWTMLIR
jgi:hypothetical protein